MNNILYIVLDSCRYDTFMMARTPGMDMLGTAELRYSYASWTSPSHYVMLMGLTPHKNPSNIHASTVYREDLKAWANRMGVEGVSFTDFVPKLSLPWFLKQQGYRTVARVSMPILNSHTSFSQYFDEYRLMQNHQDFKGMISDIDFSRNVPTFYFLNLGETHYPYMLKSEELPLLHGVHGTARHINEDPGVNTTMFSADLMAMLHRQQVSCVEYVDGLMSDLFSKCPPGTHVIITSDHGEMFGEDGFFGHGPVMHQKVFEVPYIEGLLGKRTGFHQ